MKSSSEPLSVKPAETDAQPQVSFTFERLFSEYQQPILSYLYRLLGDAPLAEELTQDVFVRAYHALPGLKADANCRAWLYRIATNAAYDQFRRRRLIRWLPFGDRQERLADEAVLENNAAEQQAVAQALQQLHPDYRAPLILYCVQGYSTSEIAAMLGISEGAVKTRLCRAREKFRLIYEEDH